MRCSAVSFGRACGAGTDQDHGVGWLVVSTPDGKKYALCSLHKLGGEVTVAEPVDDRYAERMEAVRRLAEREASRARGDK